MKYTITLETRYELSNVTRKMMVDGLRSFRGVLYAEINNGDGE